MAEYEKATDRTYRKEDKMMRKFGMRADGDKKCSWGEVCGETRVPKMK